MTKLKKQFNSNLTVYYLHQTLRYHLQHQIELIYRIEIIKMQIQMFMFRKITRIALRVNILVVIPQTYTILRNQEGCQIAVKASLYSLARLQELLLLIIRGTFQQMILMNFCIRNSSNSTEKIFLKIFLIKTAAIIAIIRGISNLVIALNLTASTHSLKS